ncbi:helix-hairpin-helix domain-containing protein [Oscillospiraceae bacterium MB08-C2-2]|nr:helix-hairpin-helix domain-containing protein [Oscillospiraceae bacterium MB08-C2-2]
MSRGYRLLVFLTGAMILSAVFYNLYMGQSYGVELHYASAVSQTASCVPSSQEPSSESSVIIHSVSSLEQVGEASSEQENAASEFEESQTEGVQFPLDINTATLEEIMLIPGVGEVTAQRIIQYREVLGGYTHLDQLMEIKGIGQATYQKLWAYFQDL